MAKLLACILLLAAAALPAAATEVHFGAKAEGIYDNNIFSASSQEQKDGSFRITPFLEAEDPSGKLHWRLRYSPAYEYFIQTTDLNPSIKELDHDVNGSAQIFLSRRTVLQLSDQFSRFHSVNRFNQAVGISGGGTLVQLVGERRAFNRNTANATLRHSFTRRDSLELSVDSLLFNFSDSDSRDRSSFSSRLRFTHVLNERLSLGASLSWSRQHFEGLRAAPATNTRFLNFSGETSWQIAPSFSINFSGGPALVFSDTVSPANSAIVAQVPSVQTAAGLRVLDISTCRRLPDGTPFLSGCQPFPTPLSPQAQFAVQNVFVPVQNTSPVNEPANTDLTFFAAAGFTKRWEQWTASAQFRRSQDSAGSNGVSSISNLLFGGLRWRPAPRWNVSLNGSFNKRVQTGTLSRNVIALAPRGLCASLPIPCPPGTLLTNVASASSLRFIDVNNDLTVTTYNAFINTSYRLTKRVTLSAVASYINEKDQGSFSLDQSFNRFTLRVGLRYEFRPVRF